MTDRFAQPPEEGTTDAEGVRIIGADEAQEAIERGEVAPRLSEQEPRHGDRPDVPEGVRPTLRFPLSESEHAEDFARPPVVPSAEPDPNAPWSGTDDAGWVDEGVEGSGQGAGWVDEGAEGTGQGAEQPAWDDPVYGAPAPGLAYDDEPAWADTTQAAAGEPAGGGTWGDGGWAEPAAQGPASAPVELPHWADPPTGEVPAVIASDEDDDLDAWSSFASSTPPRWRDENSDWAEGDYADMSAFGDEETRVGALDQDRTDDPTADPFAFDEPEPAYVGSAEADDMAGDPPARRERPRRMPRRPGGPGNGNGTGGGHRDVRTAATVGAILGVGAVVLIGFLPTFIGIIAVTAVALVAAWEYFGATAQGGARAAALVGLVATAGLPLAVHYKGFEAVPMILVLAVATTMLWYVIGAGGNAPVLEGVGTTLVGICWIGVTASFAGQFLSIHQGRSMMIAIIFVTVASDVGAFFGGQAFGHTPLSEVSPNKTREGALAGLLAAIVMGLIIGGLGVGLFSSIKAGFLLGLVAGIVAPIGDLCESVIKRDLGVKDMGTLLPEHGGILDRIDGLLFVLPAAYYLIWAAHLYTYK
ncbi:MAG: phosphatidate cytidylyltransferase [Acidimicrobiales bacterium]